MFLAQFTCSYSYMFKTLAGEILAGLAKILRYTAMFFNKLPPLPIYVLI